jgi:hypothetical protein
MSIDEINTAVNQFISHHYNQILAPSQIEILVQRTVQAIQKSDIRKKIKATPINSIHFNKLLKNEIDSLVVNLKSPWKPSLNYTEKYKKLFFKLGRGEKISILELLKDTSLINSILWDQNQKVIGEARECVIEALKDIFIQLEGKTLTKNENFHLEMIIGDFLSVYPFLGPINGEVLEIPILKNNVWKLFKYEVTEIHLTPSWMGSPIVAFGLKSEDAEAEPILLFKGTTYPSDKGAFLSLLTDFNPLGSVGSYAFYIGKEKIETWLKKNCVSKKALVFGKSLGGALAGKCVLNFSSKISKVMTYGAPGFTLGEKNKLECLAAAGALPVINYFAQVNDPVPYSDLHADKAVNYYEVVSGKSRKNPLTAHAHMYSAHEQSAVLKMKSETIQNVWKRSSVTAARATASILFFVLLPTYILITIARHIYAVIRYCFEHIFKNISN